MKTTRKLLKSDFINRLHISESCGNAPFETWITRIQINIGPNWKHLGQSDEKLQVI